MQENTLISEICLLLLTATVGCAYSGSEGRGHRYRWAIHDMNRPQPPIVTPGEKCNQPPSDAIILFDGSNLSQWVSAKDGGSAKWKVEKGYMEVTKKSGYICTKQPFGDCQLHLEWATPTKVSKEGQKRGNSGVFLMGKYEVQVLDSFHNRTYPDGQAASIYGQQPPMVNACRALGQWQSFDIIFHRPIFKGNILVKPATITVLQNGVLVQDHYRLKGTTRHKLKPEYEVHADKLPIKLQDHGNPVRYRNIWVRELP